MVWTTNLLLKRSAHRVVSLKLDRVCRFRQGARRDTVNCLHFQPDTQHKHEGSSTGLRISLCLTSFDRLI
jgi:hypothetical protein